MCALRVNVSKYSGKRRQVPAHRRHFSTAIDDCGMFLKHTLWFES